MGQTPKTRWFLAKKCPNNHSTSAIRIGVFINLWTFIYCKVI